MMRSCPMLVPLLVAALAVAGIAARKATTTSARRAATDVMWVRMGTVTSVACYRPSAAAGVRGRALGREKGAGPWARPLQHFSHCHAYPWPQLKPNTGPA